MNGAKNFIIEESAISYLPFHIGECIRKSGGNVEMINEIRLVSGAKALIRTPYETKTLSVNCTPDDLRYTVRSLCGNSVYSHSESIKEGYITTVDGIRAGVGGRAVTDKGALAAVTDISCVVMRLPHRFQGAADGLYSVLEKSSFLGSVLVYSPPGGGKTTLLRELAVKLGQDSPCKSTVVVDSRCEICSGLDGMNVCKLLGYPRHKGIEIAVRTLGADIVICDEISTDGDAEAALECLGSGVTLVASAHGTNDDIFDRKIVRSLDMHKLFHAYYGISISEGRTIGKVTYAKGRAA